MAVGDDHTLDPVLVLHQIGEIGDDQVHAVHIAVREHQAAVHHQQVVLALIHGDVLAHLAQAAQRHDLHGYGRLRGLGRLAGAVVIVAAVLGPGRARRRARRLLPGCGRAGCPGALLACRAVLAGRLGPVLTLYFCHSFPPNFPAGPQLRRPRHGRAGQKRPVGGGAQKAVRPLFRQAAVFAFFRRFPANVLKGVRQRVRPAVPVMYQRSRGRAAAFMNRIRPSGRSPRAAPCSFSRMGAQNRASPCPNETTKKKPAASCKAAPAVRWNIARREKPTGDTVSIRMRHCGPPCLTGAAAAANGQTVLGA